MSMSSELEEKVPIAELKGKVHVTADVGKQADQYTKTTKAIGEYIGRVYGQEMKMLVLQLSENGPSEPTYPEQGDDKMKAIWSKEYDHCLKKQERYADQKAKVFAIILGQCNKPMRNRVESMMGHDDVEARSNVIRPLCMVKDVAFDSNDKKYPHMQAAQAWKQLVMIRQQDDEDLVDYYKRFMSLVEMVERSHGKITPVEIAKKVTQHSKDKTKCEAKERDKFLAFMFMDGATKKVFGYLMNGLSSDHALGNGKYPSMVENALQVLSLHVAKADIEKKVDGSAEISFAQGSKKIKIKCWSCGEWGHFKRECPALQSDTDGSESGTSNKQRVSWSGCECAQDQ